MKKIAFWILTLIIIPNSIKAYECSNTDKERLQKLANNVGIAIEEQNDNKFSATFTGVSKEIEIYNPITYLYNYNVSDDVFGETTINNLKPGNTYKFKIYGYSKCYYETLRTITVNIPTLNKYYDDQICQNAREYALCQKWVTSNLTYEEFTNKVNDYILNRDSKKDNIDNDNNAKNFDFFQFYEKYYVPTFIAMICILIILILLWIRENKKNSFK